MITRSGFMKSSTARPSRKNSGFDTTSKSDLQFPAIARCTFSAVPTGTVLLSMMILYSLMIFPRSLATLRMAERSAEPSSPGGVGSASKMSSESFTLSARLVVNFSRPSRKFRVNNFSSPGSKMVISPFESLFTFSLSISTQITVFPVSAKQVPVTKPTYPVPITAIFIFLNLTIYKLEYLRRNISQLLFIQFRVNWQGNYTAGQPISHRHSERRRIVLCKHLLLMRRHRVIDHRRYFQFG